MLTLENVSKIIKLNKRYIKSGDPIHKAMIYFEFGLDGVIYLGEYSVAVTMIKKSPELINSNVLDDTDIKEKIYSMLINDFKNACDNMEKEDNEIAYNTIEMIIDICTEIEYKPYVAKLDETFIFDIYRLYAQCPYYDDLDFILHLAFKRNLNHLDFVENIFAKDSISICVYELTQSLINMAEVTTTYNNLLLILIHIYIRLYYNDGTVIDTKKSQVLIESIKDSVFEANTNVGSKTILSTIKHLSTINTYTKTYLKNNTEYNLKDDCDEDEAQEEFLFDFYEYLSEQIENIISEYNETTHEILPELFLKLQHIDGIERTAILKYVEDNVLDYNVTGFYDFREEVYLLNLLNEKGIL